MKLKLKNTPEQIELIKALGSKNPTVAREAAEAFAAFLGPVIQKVLLTAGTSSSIYQDAEFDEDDSPSYPLDLYYNEPDGYVSVWSQSMAGGLPTSQVEGMKEMKISTYRLDSAVSFNKSYARKARLDVVSKAVERMANEILIKQERNAWAVVLKALAEASTTPKGGSALKHAIASASANVFGLAELNKLMTRIKRINESYSGNTPAAAYSTGITDLYISPEIKEQIRGFAYQAIARTGSTDQSVPQNVREDIYKAAGSQEIFGVNLVELIELGAGKKYNTLFGSLVSASTIPGTSSGYWDTSADEILVGIDNSRGAFIRPVARQSESGGTFTALPDEQFNAYGSRVEKTGFYGFLEEGRICIDSRAVVGIVV